MAACRLIAVGEEENQIDVEQQPGQNPQVGDTENKGSESHSTILVLRHGDNAEQRQGEDELPADQVEEGEVVPVNVPADLRAEGDEIPDDVPAELPADQGAEEDELAGDVHDVPADQEAEKGDTCRDNWRTRSETTQREQNRIP